MNNECLECGDKPKRPCTEFDKHECLKLKNIRTRMMLDKPDCSICKLWREAGTILLCLKEDCKECGKDALGNFMFCACRNCEHLREGENDALE